MILEFQKADKQMTAKPILDYFQRVLRCYLYARYVVTLVMLCVFGSFHLIPFLCFILFPDSVSLLATFI